MRLTNLNLSEPATFVADRVIVVLTFLTDSIRREEHSGYIFFHLLTFNSGQPRLLRNPNTNRDSCD